MTSAASRLYLCSPHASVDSEKFFSLLIARIEGRPQLFLCICPAWVKNGSRETGISVTSRCSPLRLRKLPKTRLRRHNSRERLAGKPAQFLRIFFRNLSTSLLLAPFV